MSNIFVVKCSYFVLIYHFVFKGIVPGSGSVLPRFCLEFANVFSLIFIIEHTQYTAITEREKVQ